MLNEETPIVQIASENGLGRVRVYRIRDRAVNNGEWSKKDKRLIVNIEERSCYAARVVNRTFHP